MDLKLSIIIRVRWCFHSTVVHFLREKAAPLLLHPLVIGFWRSVIIQFLQFLLWLTPTLQGDFDFEAQLDIKNRVRVFWDNEVLMDGNDKIEKNRLIVPLYCTVLYCTVLYCTVLYCTVLYCTVLYCTVLYCTVQSSRFLFLWLRKLDLCKLGEATRSFFFSLAFFFCVAR